MIVATAINEPMIISSRRSIIFAIYPLLAKTPAATMGNSGRFRTNRPDDSSESELGRIEAGSLVDILDRFLADPAFHLLMHRHQRLLEGGTLGGSQHMHIRLAALLDIVQRGVVLNLGDLVGV